jgi:RNA polymerase sigma factor (sigma-70 family)
VNEPTDAELVALARQGDKEAFGRLVERYQEMAHHVALGMVAHDDVARELAQEAMLQAYLSLNHLRDDGAFRSWLYGIVLNVCRSYLRDQKAAFFSWEALAGGLQFNAIPFSITAPDPQEATEERELDRRVLEVVKTLPPKSRSATLLFYYEQLSLQEIAAVLGVSVAAVKGRLHKARERLRERLWALHTERERSIPIERRRKAMVKVMIADVVKREQPGEQPGHPHTHHVIVLLDEAGRRALPIWVGPWEGEALAIGLRGFSTPRPLTFNLMASLLEAADAKIDEVRIEALKGDTFYAVVKFRRGDAVREVDARPSDALALAVRTGSPIFAAEEVLARAGVDIPEVSSMPPGKGVDGIVKELEAEWQAACSLPRPTKEEIEKACEELVAFVFSAEA